MTETLSTQLCKLIPIEPKEIEDTSTDELEIICDECYTSWKCESPCCCINPRLEDRVRELLSRNKKLVFPDFESDTDNARFNFVRLLEELFKHPFNCKELETYRKSILVGAIEAIKENEQLKQALASTDWRY